MLDGLKIEDPQKILNSLSRNISGLSLSPPSIVVITINVAVIILLESEKI